MKILNCYLIKVKRITKEEIKPLKKNENMVIRAGHFLNARNGKVLEIQKIIAIRKQPCTKPLIAS